MTNPQLAEYIRNQLQAGTPPSQFRATLVDKGWQPDLIDEALAEQGPGAQGPARAIRHDSSQPVMVGDVAPLSFKRVSMLFMIVINTVTVGFYLPYWLWTRRAQVNSLSSKRKIPLVLIIVYTVSIILIESVRFIPENATSLAVVLSLITLVAFLVSYYMLVFRIRAALIEHLQLGTEGGRVFKTLWSVIFGPYYLQYRLNQIEQPGLSQKKSIAAGCCMLPLLLFILYLLWLSIQPT